MDEFENFPPAKSRRRQALSSIAIVWIAPILALIITVSMVINAYRNSGEDIYVTFKSGSNMEVGKTPVMYRGVQIGLVHAMNINPEDITHVDVTLRIQNSAAKAVAKEGTKFWKVEPKVSLTEVSGLDTIVRGAYITVMPAANSVEGLKARPYQDHFIGTTEKPVDVFDPGFAFEIKAPNDTDLAIGAPILFKKQIVGKIEDKHLADDASFIVYKARLQSDYLKFLHNDSTFYKLNALDIKASLAGVDIKLSSFASLIAGGITFDTPVAAILANSPLEKKVFTLYHDRQEANHADIAVILHAKESYGLKERQSKVYFNGIESGFIQSISYNPIAKNNEIKLVLQKRCVEQIHPNSYFWVVRPKLGFNRVEGLQTLLSGSYVAFSNDVDKNVSFNASVLHDAPPPIKGVHFTLTSASSHALKPGTSIFYKDIAIGEYYTGSLINGGDIYKHDIIIFSQYTHLINSSSRFYMQGALQADLNAQGLNVNVGSLEQIARGGIVVQTLDLHAARTRNRYDLFSSRSAMLEARYFEQPGLRVTLFANSANALKRNLDITYKKLPIGKIEHAVFEQTSQQFIATAFIEARYKSLVQSSSRFFDTSGIRADIDLSGLHLQTDALQSIVSGGVALLTPTTGDVVAPHTRFELFASQDEALQNNFDITLALHSAESLRIGMPITYKGLQLGTITSLDIDALQPVATLSIDNRYRHFFTQKSQIYKESFSLSLNGIKHASSILSGGFLCVSAPQHAPLSEHFTLLEQPPLIEQGNALSISISAKKLSGVKRGTRIIYHQYPIGYVQRASLSSDASHITIDAIIAACYAPLVRTNSTFFSSSGVGVDLSLFGSKIRTESLESLLQGTITLVTPNAYDEQADANSTFWLATQPEDSWLEYNASITLPCHHSL